MFFIFQGYWGKHLLVFFYEVCTKIIFLAFLAPHTEEKKQKKNLTTLISQMAIANSVKLSGWQEAIIQKSHLLFKNHILLRRDRGIMPL